MATVSGRSLLMAVQAVHQAMVGLEEELARGEGDPTDATELLLAYTSASEELRSAYEVARLGSSNLPPYATLLPPP
jgi:hypothetical protein